MPDADAPQPFEAYSGNEPYIFVSYSHKDGRAVLPDIKRLHDQGYRIWYDEGIDPGNEWPHEIAQALDRAAHFLVFITDNACASKNVRNEINFALSKNKRFLAVHLTETVLPPGLELQIGGIQAILKYGMGPEGYQSRLNRTLPANLRVGPLQLSERKAALIAVQASSGAATPMVRQSFWKRLSSLLASAGPPSLKQDPDEEAIGEKTPEVQDANVPATLPAAAPPLALSVEPVEQPLHGSRAEVVSVPPVIVGINSGLPDPIVTNSLDTAVPVLVFPEGDREGFWASRQPWFGKSRIRITATEGRAEPRGAGFGRASIRVRLVEEPESGRVRPRFGSARLARTFRGKYSTGPDGVRLGSAVMHVTGVVNSRAGNGPPQFGRASLQSRR